MNLSAKLVVVLFISEKQIYYRKCVWLEMCPKVITSSGHFHCREKKQWNSGIVIISAMTCRCFSFFLYLPYHFFLSFFLSFFILSYNLLFLLGLLICLNTHTHITHKQSLTCTISLSLVLLKLKEYTFTHTNTRTHTLSRIQIVHIYTHKHTLSNM